MAKRPTVREQIGALPTSAGMDGRNLVDRQAVLRIVAALDAVGVDDGLGSPS